jgi:hypothetical protein
MNYSEVAYIYVLIDPRDNQIRYVGKTTQPLKRLKSHIYECKNKKYKHRRAKWVRNLIKENLIPIIKFVKICPLSDFEKYEAEYIKLYQSDKLTNSDETGSGNTCRVKEVLDRQSKTSGRVVYQYDLDGNFINEYHSVRVAANYLNLSHSNISRCCNGKSKHAGGYIFRYEKDNNIESVSNPNAIKKSVIEIDIFGNKINEWESLMSCSRETGIDNGNISRVCNGIKKNIRGRLFKFSS